MDLFKNLINSELIRIVSWVERNHHSKNEIAYALTNPPYKDRNFIYFFKSMGDKVVILSIHSKTQSTAIWSIERAVSRKTFVTGTKWQTPTNIDYQDRDFWFFSIMCCYINFGLGWIYSKTHSTAIWFIKRAESCGIVTTGSKWRTLSWIYSPGTEMFFYLVYSTADKLKMLWIY